MKSPHASFACAVGNKRALTKDAADRERASQTVVAPMVRRPSLGAAIATRVFGNAGERRPSFITSGTMSFQGRSGDRVMQQLTDSSESGRGPLSFENVLRSHPGVHYFLKFCAQDVFCSESLLFWLEVRSYQLLAPGIHREVAARKIFAKFFDANAPMHLAMSEAIVARVHSILQSGAGPDGRCFDEAHSEVAYLLRYDVFPRFVRSPHYFKLVNLTLEERVRFDIEQFDLYRMLGAGGFGMVLLVRRQTNGNYFACKVIDKRIIISQSQVRSC